MSSKHRPADSHLSHGYGGAVTQRVACSSRHDETSSEVRVLAAAVSSSRNFLEQDICTNYIRSTQPFIPPGTVNRVPAPAGVIAGTSPLSGGK